MDVCLGFIRTYIRHTIYNINLRLRYFFLVLFFVCVRLLHSVCLPVSLLGFSLSVDTNTHVHAHMRSHKSQDPCIFDSRLRIINNIVFIYLVVCV